jgi:hypothetical protein
MIQSVVANHHSHAALSLPLVAPRETSSMLWALLARLVRACDSGVADLKGGPVKGEARETAQQV